MWSSVSSLEQPQYLRHKATAQSKHATVQCCVVMDRQRTQQIHTAQSSPLPMPARPMPVGTAVNKFGPTKPRLPHPDYHVSCESNVAKAAAVHVLICDRYCHLLAAMMVSFKLRVVQTDCMLCCAGKCARCVHV